jgi:hypothetical protein
VGEGPGQGDDHQGDENLYPRATKLVLLEHLGVTEVAVVSVRPIERASHATAVAIAAGSPETRPMS